MKRKKGRILSHDLLGNLYRSLDEDAVVSDVVPLLDLLVRDELGVAEAQGALVQRVAAAAGLLEVLPVGVRVEGLRDVLGFGERRVALVQDGESHLVGEGPLQQVVVLSRQHADVDGEVGALAAAVAVQEGRHLQLVAIAVSVEGRAEELVVASEFGLLEFAGVVIELPDENAVVTDRQLLHLPPQLQDLLPLTAHQVTHHSQVRFSGVFQVTADSQFGAPVFAAGVFEGAENERAATIVLHMISQILSGDVGCATLVRALDRKPRAVVLVVLDCVENELLAAVLAGLRAFGTLGHAMLRQQTTHHPRSALVLTVNTLLRTHTLVVLVGFTGELAATELALDFALGAVVLQVVRQVAARQLDGAAVGAGDHIEGAGGEVSLQLLHLAGPAAALLTVDAADGQRQDLLLQLWVRVDLGIVQRQLVLWTLEDALT